MKIINKVNLDLERPGSTPMIHAVQNDSYSRELQIGLFAGGKPYPVPGDASVLIRYRKSDGKGGEYDTLPNGTAAWTAEGEHLTVRLAPQVLTTPGGVTLSVTLRTAGAQLSLPIIRLNVQAVASAATAESENYFYVTGFLTAPQSAKVGQYIRVAEADETGRVLKTEAVSAVGGGEADPAAVTQIVRDYLAENPPEAGSDGISVTHQWNGTVLTLTSASGTSSMDLKGSQGVPGEKGEKGDAGERGEKGDTGLQGTPGQDGADGYTPVRGTDYWTAADQDAIVQQVIAVLGTPVFGTIDADNTITLSGHLADGTYTLRYEFADGSVMDIATVTIGTGYTNWLPLAAAADLSTVYNGVGYQTNRRINSAGEEVDSTEPWWLTGYIPVSPGDTVRVRNWAGCSGSGYYTLNLYSNASTRTAKYNQTEMIALGTFEGNIDKHTAGLLTFTIPADADCAYMRMLNCTEVDPAGCVFTVNQEIS